MLVESDKNELTDRFHRALWIQSLTHRDPAIRKDAEAYLLREGKEALPQILEAFEKEWKSYLSRDVRLRRVGNWFQYIGISFSLFYIMNLWSGRHRGVASILVLFYLGFMFSGWIMKCLAQQMLKCLSALYDLLLKIDSPHLVGMILEMYSADTVWLSKEAMSLIQRQLPHLKHTEWKAITPNQRQALYKILE